ncbi:MAG: NAD(P)-binding domain-containing protein [Saccharofermentanales bacterium]
MDNIRIGFIGAGKVGVTLGAYFISKGLCFSGYSSRSIKSAQVAAEITSTQAFQGVQQFVEECDMLFITTPDDQITKVWNLMPLIQY